MKVKLNDKIVSYSGKLDNMIYYYNPLAKGVVARRRPTMPHQKMNDKYRLVAQRFKAINPSIAYRKDFAAYLDIIKENDDDVRMGCWHNLFVKMMWALATKYPDKVNLETLTREQIESKKLPCRCVRDAVQAGLLPAYEGYKKLTALI